MPPKPTARNWNDVQTAIATAAIVTTLGMWNLFAAPARDTQSPTADEKEKTTSLPATEPPAAGPLNARPTPMPYVKIMFTQVPAQAITANIQQPQQVKKKKKKNDSNGGGGGSVSVTQTQSS